jgi:putative ABC transport system permease protein
MNFWLKLRRRRNLEQDLEEELAFHQAMRSAEAGHAPSGNRLRIKEDLRGMWTFVWLELLLQDIRYGLRGLRRNKGFSLTAVLLLTLGIGANTAMFTIVKRVLLDPLPWPHSERLVRIWSTQKSSGALSPVTALDYLDFADQAKSFESLGAYTSTSVALNGEGQPELLVGSQVTANLFRTLGVRPMLGRDFRAEENDRGSARVIILSHGLWRRKFGGQSDVIGRVLQVNGESFQIIGVMAPGFSFPDATNEAWIPLVLKGGELRWINRFAHFLGVVGRLHAARSIASANAEIQGIAARLEQAYPQADQHQGARVRGMKESLIADSRTMLFTLYGAVTLLLLIVCSNLAALLLERAASRRAEFSVRTALGASRGRLFGQMTIETALLSLAGGAAGVGFAGVFLDLLKIRLPNTFPRLHEIGIDGEVLGFSLGLTLLTGLLFGIAPALQLPRAVQTPGLSLRGSGGSRMRRGMRSALVVLQISMAGVLLAGAGLFLRSLDNLSRVDPGFDPRGVISANVVLADKAYPSKERILGFVDQLDRQLSAAPGVQSAGISTSLPLAGHGWGNPVLIAGHPSPAGKPYQARIQVITPHFLETVHMGLKLGRGFTERDDARAPRVALVTETFARSFLPHGESPVGQRVQLGGGSDDDDDDPQPWLTIVGVVAPVRLSALDGPPDPVMFMPYAQLGEVAPMVGRGLYLAVRSQTNATAVGAIRGRVGSLDPSLAIRDAGPMDASIGAALAPQSLRTWLLSGFAALALILAGVGLYGVIAYAVTQRRQEIGVRMALGAQASQIGRLVVLDGARLALLGIALGLAGTVSLSRLAGHLLFGVSGHDAITLSAAFAILVAVALLASYLPARRAAAIDPMQTLRSE